MGRILIDMSVFWTRSGVQEMRPPFQTTRRRSKARSCRPLGGGFEAIRGRRCRSLEGGRIRFDLRLATNRLKAVKTGPIYEYRTSA